MTFPPGPGDIVLVLWHCAPVAEALFWAVDVVFCWLQISGWVYCIHIYVLYCPSCLPCLFLQAHFSVVFNVSHVSSSYSVLFPLKWLCWFVQHFVLTFFNLSFIPALQWFSASERVYSQIVCNCVNNYCFLLAKFLSISLRLFLIDTMLF